MFIVPVFICKHICVIQRMENSCLKRDFLSHNIHSEVITYIHYVCIYHMHSENYEYLCWKDQVYLCIIFLSLSCSLILYLKDMHNLISCIFVCACIIWIYVCTHIHTYAHIYLCTSKGTIKLLTLMLVHQYSYFI